MMKVIEIRVYVKLVVSPEFNTLLALRQVEDGVKSGLGMQSDIYNRIQAVELERLDVKEDPRIVP